MIRSRTSYNLILLLKTRWGWGSNYRKRGEARRAKNEKLSPSLGGRWIQQTMEEEDKLAYAKPQPNYFSFELYFWISFNANFRASFSIVV